MGENKENLTLVSLFTLKVGLASPEARAQRGIRCEGVGNGQG